MSLDHLDILEKKIVGVVTLLVELRDKNAELEKQVQGLQQKLHAKEQELLNIQKNTQETAEFEKERELIRTKVENMLKHLKKLEGAM